MRCPSCDHDNRSDRLYCAECGGGLGLTCASCGIQNEPGEKFCGRCGQRLTEGPRARTPTPQPAPAVPASFASGRYQVQRFLGEGGKKRVYLAHDSRLDSDVAIALIKTEGLDAEGLTRIRREAQAMGRLRDHPHIVTVLDIGEEAGQPYIVQEYMEGGSVEDLLQGAEGHRLPRDQTLRIAEEVCRALEHAHGRGIVHRDLKPGNIWLTQAPSASGGGSGQAQTAKLGDFGLAVAIDRSRLTREGMMMGTVSYMPPEFAVGGGHEADARSDLYSLGAMLYEMATGRPPFLGDDAVSIISQHINTAPVAPSWHNPEVPRALEALIMRLLAKAPEERPESAAAVQEALSAIASTAATVAERVVQEEANPLDRLAGGVFVGREKEMDELRAGLEDALSGRGRLVMLVGEPGIGKTRTADEFATYARLRNAQVLWGRCYEGEGAPAYWPWVHLIRSYVHDRDPQALMSEMGPGAADIAQVVSEVRERLPGLPEPPTLEPEQARFRLFDSITTFLKNAAKGQPVVVILDDLHWADKPSLLLLQFLARELRGARLLVLGTYRDVELRREHPLADTLGELAREQLSQRILLRGLTEHDVARFIEITAGVTPPQALVDAVYRETEGNPFFANEIVRLLVTDGRLEHPEEVKSWSVTIPQGVREVVGRRLNHLSKECNRVLAVASVIGREFGLDGLERVGDLSGERLLEVLEEAVGARVVNEVPRTLGRYSFSHALIWETLYEELTTTRRVRLHRQIGEVLEALHSENLEPHLAELAYHFFEGAQGGDVDKAIDYARRAGERATELLAYEEAAGHYEMAIQALEVKDKPDEAQRCELLLALGEAQTRAGDAPRTRETFQQAVEVARQLGVPEQLARAALGLVLPGLAMDEAGISLLEEALTALGDGDSAFRAGVLGRLAVVLSISPSIKWSSSLERRTSLSQEAVDIARRGGDPATLAAALANRHVALWGPENVQDRLDAASETVRLAEQAGDKELALWGHNWRYIDLLELGDMPAVDSEIEVCARLAAELRQPRYEWEPPMWRAMRALLEGRFEEADRLAQQALAIGQRAHTDAAFNSFRVLMFGLRREQGRLHEMEAALRSFMEQYPEVYFWRVSVAFLYSEQGREAEARAEFERLAARDFADLARDGNWLIGVVRLSEICAFVGDTRRAATLYQLLLPYAGRNISAGGARCDGSASRPLGLLATTLSRWEEAEHHFEDALQMHTKMGARPWVARTQHDYAGMLLARDEPGDHEKALELVTQALETAQELGMKSLVEKALALKLQGQGLDSTAPHTSIYAIASAVQSEQPDLPPKAVAPDGTVTLLFTDIEGSTALTERLGDQRWLELLREHNTLVRECLQAHEGYEVKTDGDGFMVAFGSARRALQCAIAIQRAFSSVNAEGDSPLARAVGEGTGVRVRIGLHTGEAIKEANDFYGRHVVLASRIADEAKGCEILVSSLLRELTESTGDIAFGEEREVELKGLSGRQRVYEVGWEQ